MLLILAFSTLFILLVTFLPLSRNTHWIIRGMDFPRLQFMLFAAVLLSAEILLLDAQLASTQTLIVVTTLCLIWQLWWILPYTVLWPNEVKDSTADRPRQARQKILSLRSGMRSW